MKYLKEKYSEREKEKDKIIGSLDYIKWLEEFSETTPYFTNELESKDNTRNIENLDLLYQIIDDYARANYLYPQKTKWGNFYILEYEEKLFKIGHTIREEEFYYCDKISKTNKKTIKFLDVMEGELRAEATLINLKIQKLRLILSELIMVLPEEEIQRQVEKVYKKN